ncbi:hypothetical protein LARI1_G004578 [Lachnellula arida]|uniref:Extracellular membrane protein CFEM domain-containing protein n=1 Tax=Lachnellula arida TaxID=1316785 RepID=A0A8T9BCA8_9HELO|nr:hypothetical protein LARI1_G004578 [Lachnellula arida]
MHPSDYLPICILPLLFSFACAQTATNGAIVPFSTLPACATKCGPLYDVQGACAPPAQTSVNQNCFCTDTRLTPFLQGTSNVASVCGAASCSAESDLQAIQTWYEGYCQSTSGGTSTSAGGAATTTGTAGSSTKTSSGSSGSGTNANPRSWFSSHVKWVVMLIILAIAIPAIWIAAILMHMSTSAVVATPADGKRQKKGWLQKARR